MRARKDSNTVTPVHVREHMHTQTFTSIWTQDEMLHRHHHLRTDVTDTKQQPITIITNQSKRETLIAATSSTTTTTTTKAKKIIFRTSNQNGFTVYPSSGVLLSLPSFSSSSSGTPPILHPYFYSPRGKREIVCTRCSFAKKDHLKIKAHTQLNSTPRPYLIVIDRRKERFVNTLQISSPNSAHFSFIPPSLPPTVTLCTMTDSM